MEANRAAHAVAVASNIHDHGVVGNFNAGLFKYGHPARVAVGIDVGFVIALEIDIVPIFGIGAAVVAVHQAPVG